MQIETCNIYAHTSIIKTIKRILLTVNCNLAVLYYTQMTDDSNPLTRSTHIIIHTTSGDNLFIDYVVRVRQPSIDGIHYSTGI